MSIRAYLTRSAANPRHLAMEYAVIAVLLLAAPVFLIRRTGFDHVPLLAGSALFVVALLIFALGSWRGEPVRWAGMQRWGIAAALAGTLLWLLPL